MPNIDKMVDQLVAWGVISQVWELEEAGFALKEAITLVHNAHTHNAYPAAHYA